MTKVSDRRRREWLSAPGASALPLGIERITGAAVRSTDWFANLILI
jgi:hypothetical protein